MVEQVASVELYFQEALDAAMQTSGVNLTEPAQAYVVHLLAEFIRAERVYAGAEKGEKPIMAVLLGRAADLSPAEAIRVYQHVGDSSLYHTGFFGDSIGRELVNVEYYVSVGEQAYRSAADLARRALRAVVFEELSDRFGDLVELLGAMSLHGTAQDQQLSDERILELIERYRRTGRREVLEALAAHGVVMRPGMFTDDSSVH